MQGCGGELDVSQVGLISSPRYPQVPPSSDLDCTWTLKVPDTDLIELHFQSSKLEQFLMPIVWILDFGIGGYWIVSNCVL